VLPLNHGKLEKTKQKMSGLVENEGDQGIY